MSRVAISVSASVAVIAVVGVVIAVALVPLPDFRPLPANTLQSSIAFVSNDNCLVVADLATGTGQELRCEPEEGWINEVEWTDEGIKTITYLNQPTARILDPETGSIVRTLTGNEVIAETQDGGEALVVDRPVSGTVIIFDENHRELLRFEAPERYWVDAAVPSPDGDMVAIVDTETRLAVFDRSELVPYLIDTGVSSWPYPVWEP